MFRFVGVGLGLSVVVWALCWIGGNDPRIAFINFADFADTPSTSQLEIGSAYGPWKRSSLSLICTSEKNFMLVLKTQLMPFDRNNIEWLAPIAKSDKTTISIWKARKIDYRMDVLLKVQRLGLIDTIVSSEVAFDQLRGLVSMSGSVPPELVSIQSRAFGVDLSGTATASDLDTFKRACGQGI